MADLQEAVTWLGFRFKVRAATIFFRRLESRESADSRRGRRSIRPVAGKAKQTGTGRTMPALRAAAVRQSVCRG